MRTPRALRLVLVVALAACLAPQATAFNSVPPGSNAHDELTSVAKDAGWGPVAVKALQQAVREPDFAESELDPDADQIKRIDATEAYRPEHHCDRTPGTADAAAFEATVAYVRQQREAAVAAIQSGDGNGSVAALGRALHALQDCYSHSNIVDLPDQQSAFEAALLHGGTAPPGLKLVGFQPGADDPEDPDGDPYPHKAYAKDSANKNDESKAMVGGNESMTKFESAVMLARMGTVAFLQEFTHALPEDQRATLMQVEAEDGGAPDKFNIPGPALGLMVAALALGAVAGRRRQ